MRGGEPWPPAGERAPLNASRPSGGGAAEGEILLRRGLARVRGGEPWPPADTVVPAETVTASTFLSLPHADQRVDVSTAAASATQSAPPATTTASVSAAAERATENAAIFSSRDDRYDGPFTRRQQFVGVGVLIALAAVVVVGIAVAGARWLLGTNGMQDFVAHYPGSTELPDGAPVGFPAWLGWQHFFNAFLMIMIIRSGWQIRREVKPPAFVSGRRGKISLTVWLHQSLDVLWLVNGIVFCILLFATGQWLRVVPLSWEVFPNALSALVQYASLDWPTENGWVNYNSLQILAYFTTIFIAAPLAFISGFRMSAFWPKSSTFLNRVWKLEWARAIHFPVMLYFVVFIVVHVALVFSTGALRNLNHMYAAQGSPDPAVYANNWTGFVMFAISLAVILAALLLMRPAVIAAVARPFGTVSSR